MAWTECIHPKADAANTLHLLLDLNSKLSFCVAVKKEEDVSVSIKEENMRDAPGREKWIEVDEELERAMKESSEKKKTREKEREDHSMGSSSKEVGNNKYLLFIFSFFSHQTFF